MIPLIPALILAFISFLASAFVILRIIIPILPPHPLSKRVSPAEFGLPTFQKLSPADKAHVWLATLDLIALTIFIWQAVEETTGGVSGFASAADPASSVRLWIALTVRQTFFLVVAGITLLHVRLGRPVSFGTKHWILWAPSLVLIITSTALSGVISGAGVNSLFYGLIAYNSTIAVVTMAVFSCLVGTLFVIRRNLNAITEEMDPWPPVRETEKARPSFAAEDIDALREGGSWISSNSSTSSRRNSVSAWSFSTHHIATGSSPGHGRPQHGGHHSVPAKSSYWFGAASREDIPPVPPLPSPYGQPSPATEIMALADPDPFRRDTPSPSANHPRVRLSSQTSWLTSTNGSHTTMSAWSFPPTHYEPSIRSLSVRDVHTPSTLVSRPNTPALGSAQVLGGYGYAPGEAERGVPLATAPGTALDVSFGRNIGWFSFILMPYAFSLPYLVIVSQTLPSSLIVTIFLVLSVTLSSPILALNVMFKCPFPIPTGLFDASIHLPADLRGPKESFAPPRCSNGYKRSMSASVTVVEGRRSGDVWITKGDAVDGKSKLGRAIEVLNPRPKLSVIPPEESPELPELTPPLPIQDEDSLPVSIHNSPEVSAQFSHRRTESKTSSHLSGRDESLAVASRIMIAQRHYSTLAQTVVVPSTSTEKEEGKATGAVVNRASGHLRSRSVTSVSGPLTPTTTETFRISPTPPPPFPLPPTPPSVRLARLASLAHKKSFSSGFDFGPVDDMNEIDALTAGVLPLLVPGLRVGDNMNIRDDDYSPPGSYSKSKGLKMIKKMNEFGLDFSSPQVSSTPARRPRDKKQSGHRKNHYSLPSLGLGKDGMHSLTAWSAEIRGAIDRKVIQFQFAAPSNVEVGWRNTVFGAESIPNTIPLLHACRKTEEYTRISGVGLGRSMSTRTLGLRPEVPHEVDSARVSLLGMSAPISAASSATLFEDIEADFGSGPLAESTPHNTVTHKKTRKQQPPPLPLNKPTKHRSSIVYIKSEDSSNVNVTPPNAESTTISAMASIAQWSTRAVKPLIPKTSKIQRKISNASSIIAGAKSGSAKVGLRPLALLQDRDPNTSASPTVLSETRPLTLGKKPKSRRAALNVQDENTDPAYTLRSNGSKNLKPLKLARSETSKVRGILRQTEVLPDVVVRPPSESNHTGFAYNFHED